MRYIRHFLIGLLAGRDLVVINAHIEPAETGGWTLTGRYGR